MSKFTYFTNLRYCPSVIMGRFEVLRENILNFIWFVLILDDETMWMLVRTEVYWKIATITVNEMPKNQRVKSARNLINRKQRWPLQRILKNTPKYINVKYWVFSVTGFNFVGTEICSKWYYVHLLWMAIVYSGNI